MVPASVVLEHMKTGATTDAPQVEAQKAEAPTPDRLLTVDEAAERLSVDRRWVYRRVEELPFTRRLSTGTLRFSEKGIERWVKSRR